MDIELKISEAERVLARLAQQHEQELAMATVLPQRFEQNMAAFKQHMPSIYDCFKDYQPTRPFRIFCNENGIPNILWLDDEVALYGEDPFADAKAQIDEVIEDSFLERVRIALQESYEEQLHTKYGNALTKLNQGSKQTHIQLKDALSTDIPLSLMYGIGLGYQLGYLYERCKIRNLFAFEPDLDLFYGSLFCFDWHALLEYLDQESLSLHLFIGVDEKLLAADMMEALHRKGAFWSAAYFSFFHYHSPKIYKLIEQVETQFYLLRTSWGFFDDNITALAHSHTHLQDGTPFLKLVRDMSLTASLPVFVVGNGPSLDQSIDFIKEHQYQAIIIACGSAVSALYKVGIQPDICVAVERTKSSADFFRIMDADDFLKESVFLTVDVIHPECKAFFRKTGMAFKPNEAMYMLLTDYFGDKFEYDKLTYSNPFVGNLGVNYAALLGFKEAYLFGIDNGYHSAEKHHSRLSLYYTKDQKVKYQQDLRDTFPTRSNFGNEIRINHVFGLSIHNMASVLRDNPELQCFNTSDGAYIEGATPRRVDTIVADWPVIDKRQVVDEIMEHYFQPFDVTNIDVKAALNMPLFHDVIEKLRHDWQTVSREHNTVQLMMLRHHDYLLYLFVSRASHLYRVLIGSINYFYADIISLMLAQIGEGDEVLIDNLESVIAILDNFFTEAQYLYSTALERHDISYSASMDMFKSDNV